MKLHASGESYLKAIYILEKKNGMVRSVDVATHMGVSKPSVSHAVKILQDCGVIYIADKPEFKVYDTYIDNGLSGTTFRRPAFQQMLSDIEAGHIDCVIVKDLSRLGRNFIDTSYYIEQYFSIHNVRFIAVTDQFDTADLDNLHGGIMLPLKNMIKNISHSGKVSNDFSLFGRF